MFLTSHMIYIIESHEFLADAEIFLSICNVFYSRETFKMCLPKLSSRNLIEKKIVRVIEKNYELSLLGNNLFSELVHVFRYLKLN
jgi:hypothetical protein